MKHLLLSACCLLMFAANASTQYSKLSIITAAKASGKWQTLKAFIASHDLEDEWQAASYISDAHPAFVAATNAVILAGVATADEISAFLDASRDFAVPDDLFAKYYARQMSNATERTNWHGKVTTNIFDKTAKTKTTRYADGFVWTQPFAGASPRSRSERISDAERKAQREQAAREAAERAAQKRLARIALLTTNLTAEVSALMKRKQWPEDLARLYLLHELNTLTTNTINAVITPQAQ